MHSCPLLKSCRHRLPATDGWSIEEVVHGVKGRPALGVNSFQIDEPCHLRLPPGKGQEASGGNRTGQHGLCLTDRAQTGFAGPEPGQAEIVDDP